MTETGWEYCFAGWDLKLSEAPVVAFYWLFNSLSIVLFSFLFCLLLWTLTVSTLLELFNELNLSSG